MEGKITAKCKQNFDLINIHHFLKNSFNNYSSILKCYFLTKLQVLGYFYTKIVKIISNHNTIYTIIPHAQSLTLFTIFIIHQK